ncbi:polyprenol monophosphomannose synthase [Salinibacterium sp. dk2585]|uniref:polyprenol monophosphomannose synthase n=1 Tax=unclassified Salinibacterium TaxID=2632331 RepID=UPI0011C2491A|nr:MULTISPECIES: polyprenol monophosphomannose synthase [unclassified Salinibacterium]QEE61152.1 polyprenol monophosphomannose synthase [Salinibacterium sp. dk2585]TXK53095.1 polyprenol monophosphomannose synthase [Salinibacterium sp. dk5596]
MPETVVLVPTYNEAASIRAIIQRIHAAVPDAHVLVLDDASPDGTGAIVGSLAAEDPRVAVLHRADKQGLGAAYRAGFEYALDHGYDRVVEIDADGSHDPAELPAMLRAAETADLVIGSRWVAGGGVHDWPRHRLAVSRLGNRYARAALGSTILDLTAGFRVYRSSALRMLDLERVSSQGYCFQVEMAWRLEQAGCTVAEHPILFQERTVGRSKMHIGIVAEALIRVTGWGLQHRLGRGAPLR